MPPKEFSISIKTEVGLFQRPFIRSRTVNNKLMLFSKDIHIAVNELLLNNLPKFLFLKYLSLDRTRFALNTDFSLISIRIGLLV